MTIKAETKKTRENSLGWALQRLARRVDAEMAAQLQQHDLTVLQFAVMMAVLEHPAMTQSRIGQRFGAPPYTVSRALDVLEERGYVERRIAANSRRSHEIHATQSGEALAPKLHAIVRHVNANFAAPLNMTETDQLLGLLHRLLAAT